MSYKNIQMWADLQIQDLLLAYRKCKADCFYERSLYATEAFVHYEENLWENLRTLLDNLRSGDIAQVLSNNLGTPRIFAKKLGLEASDRPVDGHSFFSDADRNFERLRDTWRLVPEFRVVGDFPVEMHVLSALWINTVGHKYDSRLYGTAHGSRLRRYRSKIDSEGRPTGAYHKESVGSFEPYFKPYKAWRDGGMRAIESALKEQQSVVALTLDFSSYYHNVDPAFMVDERFLAAIDLDLNSWETEFTKAIVDALSAWSKLAQALVGSDGLLEPPRGGLPIGLSAVRIITNVLLIELDRIIKNELNPIFYGRYVDDIFLVLNDPGHLRGPADLWDYIRSRADSFSPSSATGEVSVVLPGGYQGDTRLVFQTAKQKLFFLKGQSGLDLLDSIAHQVRSLSSERRLMPLPEELEGTASARVLAASETTAEDADSLRRADGLTIRRLGWALQLRSVEILARDLEAESWRDERRRFYEFARAHILRPDKVLEQLDYLPRLLSIAISLADWEEAINLLRSTMSAVSELERAVDGGPCKINGIKVEHSAIDLWTDLRAWILASCRDAVVRSWPWNTATGLPHATSARAADLLKLLEVEGRVQDRALAVREADLAKKPYREHLRNDALRERAIVDREAELELSYPYSGALREFLELTRGEEPGSGVRRLHARCERADHPEGSILPFLVPTRPYTAQEVALFLPRSCVFGEIESAARQWAEYLRAVRGIWSHYEGIDAPPIDLRPVTRDGEVDPNTAIVGKAQGELRLGITSLLTSDECWALGAAGQTDLSPARYRRLATITNLAIKADPRPTHLLLPELSLPQRWLGTLAGVLLDSRISLIAGLDYEHYEGGRISSSAALVLTDERLGYPSAVQIRQPKLFPAPGEEENLHVSHGKIWRDWGPLAKPIYIHDGYHFGVLVCSELQNVMHRERFQGEVDWLAILSWNRDLETFSALVESASLDVHAYIALVNNRHYGDSRVRAPLKDNFGRDVCRIRGGLNEHLVVVRVDPAHLRAQQSRAHRWPRPHDRYKPAPEGYRISPSRRVTPS